MTGSEFFVRKLGELDLDDWFRLRTALWDATSDNDQKSEMLEIIENPEIELVLVAESNDGALVGFLEASIRPFVEDCHSERVGYLEGWFVLSEFRLNGIGKILVKGAENWARSNGCEEMASDAEIGNDLSLQAHLKLGYEETSRLVHLRKDLI